MSETMKFESRMSDSDALMWTIEKDPMLRSTITVVMTLDGPPDPKRLRALVDRGSRLIPRMRQRVRGNPMSIAPPRWEIDPNFDLDYHLRWVGASGDKDLRSVLDLAQPIAMQGFDRARPLWELTVVDGLAGGGAAVVLKVHHAITDGIGGIKIALILFELERETEMPEMPVKPEGAVLGHLQRLVDAWRHEQRRNVGIAQRSVGTVASSVGAAASDPFGSAHRAVETAKSIGRLLAPSTSAMSKLMADRSLSVHFDTVTVPLADAKAAARAAGGRLNDIFLAATADAFRRYHEEMGAPVPEALRMSMPISVRDETTADLAGNQFVPARFPLPLGGGGLNDRIQLLRRLVQTQRGEPALQMVEPLARILNQLPTFAATGMFGAMLRGVDLVTSNVPGAPFPIYIAGSRVEKLYALGPMAGAAANITLVSYQDELCIGINVDPAAVTEPERLVAAHHAAWDEVLSTVG